MEFPSLSITWTPCKQAMLNCGVGSCLRNHPCPRQAAVTLALLCRIRCGDPSSASLRGSGNSDLVRIKEKENFLISETLYRHPWL